MPDSFFDTNIIVYLASADPANVARRKLLLSWPDTHELLSTLRELLTVEPITIETHIIGISIAQRYNLALYDAMIVAAAFSAGCERLWSEDMQHGLLIDGRVRVTNPFAPP